MAQAALINPTGANVTRTMLASLLSLNGNEMATGTAAPAVVTFDPDVTRPTIIRQIMAGYGLTPAAGATVKVEDGPSNIVWQMPLPAAGVATFTFDPPLAGTKGNPLIVTLASGAGTVIGYLFANAYREQ